MRLTAGLAACLILVGCRGSTPSFLDAPVVLISIDTLRADRLPAYGYAGGSTPNIDRLATEAMVFEDVYSQCPLTLPSHASLFTALLPTRHGVRDNIGFTLAAGHTTLASRFRDTGWKTGAAVSTYVLRHQTGIARGFDFYDDAIRIEKTLDVIGDVQRDGRVAVDSLAGWIASQGANRYFAFLHLYEPHSPYAPPTRYGRLPHPYDGEVAYADELVGTFLDRLRALRQFDRAVIALVSDHGEGLKDHGEQEHGIFLYREALRVPFILRLPGAARGGTRVKGTSGLVDVPTTLLDLVGLRAPDGVDGATLVPAIVRGALTARRVYSETLYPRYHLGWSELYAATEGRQRYIQAPRPELYDIDEDPAERRNLAGGRASTIASLHTWLAGRVKGEVPRPDAVPPSVRQRLEALGYVGSEREISATPGEKLPDPKDQIGTYEQLREALAARSLGDTAGAIAKLQELVQQYPSMLDAWEALGTTLVRTGRQEDGIAALERVLRLDPMKAETHLALARIYALDRRRDLAMSHAEIATVRNPAEAYEVRAELLMDEGRFAEAADAARKSIEADATRAMSQFILGTVARRDGRCDEALRAFENARHAVANESGTIIRGLYAGIGDCLARQGRNAEAEAEFAMELRSVPDSRDARLGLAMLYRSLGRDRDAREVLGGLAQAERPATAETYWLIVRTFAALGDREAAREWAARGRARFPRDARFR